METRLRKTSRRRRTTPLRDVVQRRQAGGVFPRREWAAAFVEVLVDGLQGADGLDSRSSIVAPDGTYVYVTGTRRCWVRPSATHDRLADLRRNARGQAARREGALSTLGTTPERQIRLRDRTTDKFTGHPAPRSAARGGVL